MEADQFRPRESLHSQCSGSAFADLGVSQAGPTLFGVAGFSVSRLSPLGGLLRQFWLNVDGVKARQDQSPSKWDWREILMDNQFGSRGFVCYSLMTEQCEPFGNVIETAEQMNITARLSACFEPAPADLRLFFSQFVINFRY